MVNFKPDFFRKKPKEDSKKEEKIVQQFESGEYELSPEIKKLIDEGIAKTYSMETGGKSVDEYKYELSEKLVVTTLHSRNILEVMPESKNRESYEFIRLTPKDLGFIEKEEYGTSETRPTVEKVYKRAQELGIDLGQAEDGPEFAIWSSSQESIEDKTLIAMEQLKDSTDKPSGASRVFNVRKKLPQESSLISGDIKVVLDSEWGLDDFRGLDINTPLLFRLKKKTGPKIIENSKLNSEESSSYRMFDSKISEIGTWYTTAIFREKGHISYAEGKKEETIEDLKKLSETVRENKNLSDTEKNKLQNRIKSEIDKDYTPYWAR